MENANVAGLCECIHKAFERSGINNFQSRLVGLNIDGASVNLGIHNGLGALMKNEMPWLEVIHYFDHRVELAVNDAFKNDTYFKQIIYTLPTFADLQRINLTLLSG